jgi:hypothetical protein
MADGLLGAYFGNPNLQRQGARARALAKQRDVNLLADPKTYAVVQGLLGTPPDQLGFSVLNPKYQEIKQVAEPAFYAGSLLQMSPATAPAVNRIAKTVGPKLEQTLLPAFEAAYNRGGLTREMVEAMGTGSRSQIIPVNVAREIEMPISLPKSKEFFKAVENEPSAQITDQGLLLNLKRLQDPNQSGGESVRTGVFYLPEGQSSGLKNYKGKTGYGGSEPIEGETLYKNPLFVKGATGGKAPESAYDQINGKGAYQAMRTDILNSYGYNSNQSQKIEAVQGILEKYNALDSDDAYNMAYNIVSNSKTGNTLPYAVQENIVANSVRNAGYDAVLGYGKGKGDKGEFFSEVFDVREASYPTPSGAYELLPTFEEKRKKTTGLLD